MTASQMCPDCGSPLDPCKCGAEARKRRQQIERNRNWRTRGTKAYEERVRKETLEGDRPWNTVPPVNRDRKTQEFARTYGSPERAAWVRSLPSVVSGKRPCVNAHVPDPNGPSGMGRKADARWIVPLTLEEELELHRVGIETFQRTHGVDLQAEARRIDAQWQAKSQIASNCE